MKGVPHSVNSSVAQVVFSLGTKTRFQCLKKWSICTSHLLTRKLKRCGLGLRFTKINNFYCFMKNIHKTVTTRWGKHKMPVSSIWRRYCGSCGRQLFYPLLPLHHRANVNTVKEINNVLISLEKYCDSSDPWKCLGNPRTPWTTLWEVLSWGARYRRTSERGRHGPTCCRSGFSPFLAPFTGRARAIHTERGRQGRGMRTPGVRPLQSGASVAFPAYSMQASESGGWKWGRGCVGSSC